MIILALQNHVATTLSKPGSAGEFDKRISQIETETGTSFDAGQREELREVAEGYVSAVVDFLGEADAAATAGGLLEFAGPLLQHAAGYFLNQSDEIPDHHGLYGLLDDAYLACRFVTRISETVHADRGFPLIDTSLDEGSYIIRFLIGNELAERLDAHVELSVQQMVNQTLLANAQRIALARSGGWEGVIRGRQEVDLGRLAAIASGSWG